MSKSCWSIPRLNEKRLRLRPCLRAIIGLNRSRLAAQGAQAEVKERRDQETEGDKPPVRKDRSNHRQAATDGDGLQAAEHRQHHEAEEKQHQVARGLLALSILARQRQGFAKQKAE